MPALAHYLLYNCRTKVNHKNDCDDCAIVRFDVVKYGGHYKRKIDCKQGDLWWVWYLTRFLTC